MKNLYLGLTLILTFSFLLMPLIAVDSGETEPLGTSSAPVTDTANLKSIDEFRLYFKDTEKVENIKTEEYLLGVLAAEMAATNNAEALKAQALAAYTFAYRKATQNKGSEYDLTNDSSLDQGYIDAEGRKAKWGEKQTEYEKKLKDVITAVKDMLIVYDNQPIFAAYHAISPGNTESAENVWGSAYPYLKSKSSAYDLLCPQFLSEVKVTTDDFKNKLISLGATPGDDAAKYIGKNQKTTAGTVKKITLCGKDFTGAQLRTAFNLRSAAFDLTFSNNTFIFTVNGYGHAVGMSQFGANYMAEQGSTYTEILNAYYEGIKIVKLK